MNLNELGKVSHEIAVEKGWYDCPHCDGGGKSPLAHPDYPGKCRPCVGKGTVERTVPEVLMLMVSELAEALEEYRDGRGLKETYYVKDAKGGKKPCGFPTELADAVIRICETCSNHGIDLDAAVAEKTAYNRKREYRHPAVPGGKGKLC